VETGKEVRLPTIAFELWHAVDYVRFVAEVQDAVKQCEVARATAPAKAAVAVASSAVPQMQPPVLKFSGPVKDDSSVAVVIGIRDYNLLGEIPGCAADARAFADAFREARGMNPRRIVLMTDDGEKSRVPTRSLIQERIRMCASEAKADGMALVYFSGHAVTKDGQAMLVPWDCDMTEGIAVSWVTDQLKQSKARDKVLIVDACHSGAREKGVLVVEKQSLGTAEGVAMFLSCGKDENSYPVESGKRSIYTDVFLRCLREAAKGPSAVTARALEQKIEEEMSGWRLQTGRSQTPQLILAEGQDMTLVPVALAH
jgi:hypothetical protein